MSAAPSSAAAPVPSGAAGSGPGDGSPSVVPVAVVVGEVDVPDVGTRYVPRGYLGAGGMSRVYRVFDRARDEEVALKILNDDSATRLGSEFRFIASLNHPGVIGVHDFGLTADGRPFFSMELARGGDIVQFARRAPRRELIRAVREVFETLSFVHARGVVHGDLKPGNILFSRRRSEGGIARLLDFGIARRADEVDGGLAGTVHYMAPELILGRQRDHRTDLYAMGTLLYELLTGRVPFDAPEAIGVLRLHLKEPAPDPALLEPEVAGPLSEIVLRLLEKSPADRFGRARDVARALDEWIALDEAGGEGMATTAPPELGIALSRRAARSSARNALFGAATSVPRVAGGARFVGREAELQQLVAGALDMGPRAVRPRREGSLWVVHGPAGIGKTRLVDEMGVRVQLGGLDCLFVDFSDTPRPSAALRKLGAVVAGAAGDPSLRDEIALRLRDGEPAHPKRLGGAEPLPEAPRADRLIPVAEQLARVGTQLAEVRPFVLVLDALHVVGEEASAALRVFVSTLVRSAVMVVATGADATVGSLRDLAQLPLAKMIGLERLGRDGTAHIVRSLLGEMEGSVAIIDHVHQEGAGIPGVIEHAVRALVAVGTIVARHDAWVVAPELGGKLPALAPDARQAEIARALVAGLRVEAVDLACAAASIGVTFELALLVSVAGRGGMAEGETTHALRELLAARVLEQAIDETALVPPAVQLRFGHRAIAEALLGQAHPSALQRWSRCIVDVVEQRGAGERGPELDALLARHLVANDQRARAAALASRLIAEAGPSEAMVRVMRDALGESPLHAPLEPDRWCELTCLLAETELYDGDTERAIDCYERVVRWTSTDNGESGGAFAATARPVGDGEPPRSTPLDYWRVTALCGLGDLWMEQGRADGETTLRQALAEARELASPDLVGQAAYALANRLTLAGRHDDASAGLAEALRVADANEDRPLRARALKLSATLQWYRGRLGPAAKDARRSADEYRALGSPQGAALALGALGNAWLASGQLGPAATVFREALEQAHAARWLTGIGKLENGLAVVAFRSDDWDGACEHWRAALAIADRTGNCLEQVILTNNVAFVAARRGDGRGASRLYREALGLAERIGFPRGMALVCGNIGELRASQGRLEEARSELSRSLDLARSIGSKVQEIEAQRRLVDVALLEGREAALALVADTTELLDAAQAASIGTEVPSLRRTLGTALAAARFEDPRREAEAARELEQAALGFEQLGSHYEVARVIALAAVLAGRGVRSLEPLAARVDEARRLFRRLRAQPDLDLLRRTQHGVVRGGALAEAIPGEVKPFTAAPTIDASSLSKFSLYGSGTLRPTLDPDVGRLLDALRKLADVRGLDDLLPRLVDEAISLAGAERGFVVLCNESGIPLRRVSRGMGGQQLEPEEIRVSRGILEAVMAQRQPVVTPDLAGAGANSLGESVAQLGIRTVACLPLLDGDWLVGVLYVDAARGAPECSPQRLSLLEPFAHQAALALVTARRIEQHARHAEAVATSAHELVNPIRAIVGYCRLIRQQVKQPPHVLEGHAAMVQEQVRRLSRMVSGLVDLADTTPADIAWTAVSVQVKDLVETAVEQLSPIAAIRAVEIELVVPAGLPTLFGSRDRLLHALVNLIATSVGLCGRGRLLVQASWADASVLSQAPPLPSREEEIDPLLPAPDHGWELSTDVPLRIDITSIPSRRGGGDDAPAAEAERDSRREACDAVIAQLAARVADGGVDVPPGAEAPPPGDPTLRVASRLVAHHGGVLWGEPVGEDGVRLSILLPVLVQPR